MDLTFPSHLSAERRDLLIDVADRAERTHGDAFLGLVLSGSAGRGLATERSDVDVDVILASVPERVATAKSSALDEATTSLDELEELPTFGSDGWWYRWSYAWAPVLLDRSGGAVTEAVRCQASVTPEEADSILIEHDRLDGWLNYAYRSRKSDRDGRALESRLDAVESLPWLLDTIFSIAGRVRPYHKYLPWELREHPVEGWPADVLLPLLTRTADGDPAALRETFTLVASACDEHDAARGHTLTTDTIRGWGDELELFRG
ncbi:hypothetical protein [Nocardioides currus]|uniref:hypothetical protein n=1 Tax=Nocardioides currus TaxID=2133958 RepID=UPI001056E6E7|nr:hypothetical protein [Nocardioides currus]